MALRIGGVPLFAGFMCGRPQAARHPRPSAAGMITPAMPDFADAGISAKNGAVAGEKR
ncbi:DUF817 domain-containing protein [Chelatococcus daeguensis]|uniref:DUF817 domain-containing protein n=1 Tax=Chelatococcus daeguensis TaxID=444444 RepID=UPI000B33AD93|nr:DUF817 domain-containing protein [Chelatococcus daeguensis]